MADQNIVLQTRAVSKGFPGVRALSNVSFALQRGEIHGLMGENGAGKSTLIKVLTGVEKPDTGEILLEDAPITPRSPHDAQDLGISTVYQEVNLCGNLSVAENMFIGRLPRTWGRIDWKTIYQRAEHLLKRLDVVIDVRQPLDTYSVAIQQMVAIARALDISAKVLILDEPTASLDASEVQKLFGVLRQLRAEGLGIVFVTHFLEQVYAICDRITILRQGELIGTYQAAALSRFDLVSKMLGKALDDLEQLHEKKSEQADQIVHESLLHIAGLGKQGSVQPFDLDLVTGQVLGFAGLLGSGRTEMARLIFGIDKADSGSVELRGQRLAALSPSIALRRGIGLCPENRRADGIIPDLSVRENIVLALQAGRGWTRTLSAKEQQQLADRFIRALNIKTPNAEQPVKNLSGGNQQKVILARWLAINPAVLILDEPTRGIDIGTKTEIQKLVLQLAAEGKAVIFISSELEEVLRCSHQIVVLRDRQKVAELSNDHLSEEQIMRVIAERTEDGVAPA